MDVGGGGGELESESSASSSSRASTSNPTGESSPSATPPTTERSSVASDRFTMAATTAPTTMPNGGDFDTEPSDLDVCRVCRMESSPDRPLFYPCICTGSIKYVHQECLMQWLKYSKKEYCELCNHKYHFQPIYHPDMPTRLPIRDVIGGLGKNVMRALHCWLIYTVVALAWLGLVPLAACRIYRAIFAGSLSSILALPLDLISTKNLITDIGIGAVIIGVFLCVFVCLVWLKEQIVHGGPQHLLNLEPLNPENDQVDLLDDPAADAAADEAQAEDGQDQAIPAAAAAPLDQEQEPQQQQDDLWPLAGLDGDRPNEELSWERLLGLDGSFAFLEHLFWVISLNTFFTLVFAFSPYHLGSLIAHYWHLKPYLVASKFDGLLSTLLGYVSIWVMIFVLHQLARAARFQRAHRATGMAFLTLKVFLLVLTEAGLFPTLCGWWLDLCSLRLFAVPLSQRVDALVQAPGTTMFLHWLVGMLFVFYVASFVLILREVLRPGCLWFLRNLNDPDFNPIQEMITKPVVQHVRRVIASSCLFAINIWLVIYVPINFIANVLPAVLPYKINMNGDVPVSELSLELLLLQVVLPALLEQGQARQAMKAFIHQWCVCVGGALQLTDYLLGSRVNERPNVLPEGDQAEPLLDLVPLPPAPLLDQVAGHQNVGPGARDTTLHEPYVKPNWFPLRMCVLLCAMAATSVCCSVLFFTVPVSLGRVMMQLLTGETKSLELYSFTFGLYLCYVILKLGTAAWHYLSNGWPLAMQRAKAAAVITLKCVLAFVSTCVLLPLLLGVTFQLLVLTPMRVSQAQTPLYFPWQDWALGVLHFKIICALVMVGPNWWLHDVLEQLYQLFFNQDGVRQLNIRYLYTQLVIPLVSFFGCIIALPYVAIHALTPLAGVTLEQRVMLQRNGYPLLLCLGGLGAFLVWQGTLLKNLVIRIRDEKYLVGQRLVNYDEALPPPPVLPATAAAAGGEPDPVD